MTVTIGIRRWRLHSAALAAACFTFVSIGTVHAQTVPPGNEEPGLGDLVRLCETDRQYASRFYGVPWSETRFERLARVYDVWEARLGAVDFERLTVAGRVDHVLLRNELETNRSRLALDRRRLAEMSPLLPGRDAIQALEFSRRRRDTLDVPRAAEALAAIPEQLKKVRERLEKGREAAKSQATSASTASAASTASTQVADANGPLSITPTVALRAARAIGDLQHTLHDWYAFHDGYQPEFSWWVRKPRETLDAALTEYAKFLRETIAGVKGQPEDPLIGDPIGSEALLGDLSGEMIAYSPTELIAIAEREFAWCEERMREASRELGAGDDWKSALKAVKEKHAPPGMQDEVILDEARLAVEFLKRHKLVTIPAEVEEMWRVEMLSPETQKSLPYAVYGGQYVGAAYPTDAMSHDDKLMAMRGNNRHFTHIVTPHELIPGHHLQGYFAERFRPYRGTFSTPFFVEGWAVYWEMRLWELGYARDAADRVGMLFWRMHRCARILVSLKYHLGEMSPQQMVDFLIERVGHEKSGATSEVRRYIGGDYSPLYQCGYMVGALQVRALHREMVQSGRMTDQQFNDTLLTRGAIPIEMIRAELGLAPLARDMRATWKFVGDAANATLPHP